MQSLQRAYQALIPESVRAAFYRALPGVVKSRVDNLGQQPDERPLTASALSLPRAPITPARFSRRVNKLAAESDWYGEEWLSFFDALGEPHFRQQKHRKGWEWAQGAYALEQLGLLHEDAAGLGVGAGKESILFYLANRTRLIVASDIYGEGVFANGEASASMLADPRQYARIPYPRDHLQVMYMDGRSLDFPDDNFDFTFSFSSIEHFGGHEASAQAVSEMARVTRPGGAIVMATEIILNGIPDDEFFLPEEVEQYLIPSGTRPIEEIDYTMSDQTFKNAVDSADPDFHRQLPHLVIKRDPIYFTSISLVLEKRGSGLAAVTRDGFSSPRPAVRQPPGASSRGRPGWPPAPAASGG
jgi:SAM-dependent methyltransferase